MSTDNTEQTPWYSRKGLFLLVGAIIIIVSVFGYRTTQLRLDMATQFIEGRDCYMSQFHRNECLQMRAERQDYTIYNSLSIAGSALGLILVVYGLIPKRQSR